MECLVESISVGLLSLPEMRLNPGETARVKFNDRIRYYVAEGYIKLLDLYYDDEYPNVINGGQPLRAPRKYTSQPLINTKKSKGRKSKKHK